MRVPGSGQPESSLRLDQGGAVLVVDGTGRGHALCDLFVRTKPAVTVCYGPGSGVIPEGRIIPVPELSLAGPAAGPDGQPVTAGGRVVHMVGEAGTAAEAQRRAYAARPDRLRRQTAPARHRQPADAAARTTTQTVRHRGRRRRPHPDRPGRGPGRRNRRNTRVISTILPSAATAIESKVRSHSRAFPAVFCRAKDEWLDDSDGTPYLDFFSGAGALNYGHNTEPLKTGLLDYLLADGLTRGWTWPPRPNRASSTSLPG